MACTYSGTTILSNELVVNFEGMVCHDEVQPKTGVVKEVVYNNVEDWLELGEISIGFTIPGVCKAYSCSSQ